MRALVVLALTLRLVSPSLADAPSYSSDTIVNGASYQPGALAPNTIAILYGQNLSMGTAAFTADNSGFLPLMLPGTGAQLSVGSLPACAVYVSPTQITFLVPPNLPAGTFDLRLLVNGSYGPTIQVQVSEAAPALFQIDSQNAMAIGVDGSLLSPDAPAHPGDSIVLYATGLGQPSCILLDCEIPLQAVPLNDVADFIVLLDGVAVDPAAISYVGLVPGFAGTYEVDLTLPLATGDNPQVQIGFPDSLSPAGVTLPVQSVPAQTRPEKP